MLYRLCKDTFTRHIESYGYVSSQLTHHDRVYDPAGAAFLEALDRTPRHFDDLVARVATSFIDAPLDELRTDLLAFLHDLEAQQFVVSGEDEAQLQVREPRFSYAMANPKTAVYNFRSSPDDRPYADTSEFFYQLFHQRPHIFSAQIELTNRCNEKCLHCYIPHEQKTQTLETALLEKVLHELAEMGTLGLTLSGGELFLHSDIEKILRWARQLDFSINILSNLTPLKPRHIALLQEINPSLIQTSLYSMDAAEHDHITQLKGSHAKTLAALHALIEVEIPVQISCPVMRTNLHSYRAVLEWAQRHRCKAQTDFIMMARTDFSTDNLAERITLAEQELLLKDILEVDIDYGGLLEEPRQPKSAAERAAEPVCGVAVDNICLAANGTFYPCSGWQGLAVGDARTQSVREVWETSPQLQQLRQITKGSFPGCLSCPEQDFCAMCLVRNFNESGGDLFKINPHFCQSAALNRKLVKEHYAQLGKADCF